MKILVRGTNWIGDAVMTIPALMELRRIFPGAHITLHIRSWAEGIFRNADYIDGILPIADEPAGVKGVVIQANALRAERFDLAIIFPGSYRSAAVARLAKIPRRFGYKGEGRKFLLSDRIRVPEWKSSRHESMLYLGLVAEVERRILRTDSVRKSATKPIITVSNERKEAAHNYLRELGVDPALQKVIGIGVGSTNSMAKRWPAENFAKLIDELQDSGAKVLLFGSESESNISQTVNSLSRSAAIDLTGKTSIAEVVQLMTALDVFISNDMGLAHIAAAVGIPTRTIFGPTNPVTTAPLGIDSEIIREPVECSPCMLRQCPIDHRCMTRITVERVYDHARLSLGLL
ncbi:MAG: lipopolysaccharide heptosyltransferase II [Blastocatellia bacterium]|nr:lipopolysaccharide heptosyltransferase II [Blastocatellia bacterium]